MPKLRRIAGQEVVKILLAEGFAIVRQKSSHIRLVMEKGGATHYLTVPVHNEIDRGTLKSIIRLLERCLTEEKIHKLFYTS